jgi:hypothetical protein
MNIRNRQYQSSLTKTNTREPTLTPVIAGSSSAMRKTNSAKQTSNQKPPLIVHYKSRQESTATKIPGIYHVQKGLPTGHNRFKLQIEEALSIKLHDGRRGRPKKAN